MTLNPAVIVGYVVAIVFEIGMPLVVGFFIARRYHVRWRYFWFGALVFFLSQIVTRIPLVQVVQSLIAPTLAQDRILFFVWILILSITAGLFEETGRYLGYRFLVKDNKTWSVGLMFGAGHGGLESMLLTGGLVLLGLVNIVLISTMTPQQLNVPPDQMAALEQARQQIAQLNWWDPLLGAYERVIAVFLHMALSILVLQVFLKKAWIWYWAAIALHALVNLVAVLVAQNFGPIWAEVALTFSIFLSIAIIRYFKPSAEPNAVPAGAVVT